MDTEFSRRMSASVGKRRVAQLASDCSKILDLGAGNGCISAQLAEMGKDVTAVEIDPSNHINGVRWICEDLRKYVRECDERYDCIILSAVLHELSFYDIFEMSEHIKRILTSNGKIIIREALASSFGPFMNPDERLKEMLDDVMMTAKGKEYKRLYNKKGRNFNNFNQVDKLNAAFAIAYGNASWEREKHELRFCHKLEDILMLFCMNHIMIELEKDESYKKWFEENDIDSEILDYVRYTSMVIMIR